MTTVARVVKDLGALRPRQFVFVGDRGMVSQDNIDFLESRRLKYILAVKGRSDPLASEAFSQKGRFIKVKDALWVKEKILEGEARLDGKYIFSTNDFSLPPGEIAQGYKNLSRIEAAFQSMKHVLDKRLVNRV